MVHLGTIHLSTIHFGMIHLGTIHLGTIHLNSDKICLESNSGTNHQKHPKQEISQSMYDIIMDWTRYYLSRPTYGSESVSFLVNYGSSLGLVDGPDWT
ncbi:12058_t:CDS:2 [Cetraspora pellucida]|uniref:12058_t:CDS:1 n=1 Tax=Cetraspora pellucida TaxID=1433469 RepID=A0ACA9KPV5_9GLOM|nr:12058_t:CDS:2 [Cetraspora pellucida]